MSGGSMDYLYRKVEAASFRLSTPQRRAFAHHLEKVAKALHDIEWVDSNDYVEGKETEAIEACLTQVATLNQLVTETKATLLALTVELDKLK